MRNGKWKQSWSGRFEDETEKQRDIRQQAEHITLLVTLLVLIVFGALEKASGGEFFGALALGYIIVSSMSIVRAVRERTRRNTGDAVFNILIATCWSFLYIHSLFF